MLCYLSVPHVVLSGSAAPLSLCCSDMEIRLPRERLYALSALAPVQAWVRRTDFLFYQALVKVLIPDVLRPIPSE